MTLTMTGVTGYATLTQLMLNSEATRARLDRLSNQASTGLVSVEYAGLGSAATTTLNLRPQLANLQTWQSNIDAANGRMGVAQAALSQVQSIAADFYQKLNTVDGINASAIDGIAAQARDALGQVANLLNSQDGGVYVFAGQDTGNPPIPDAANILTSGFYAQINAAVTGLVGNGAALTVSATWNVAMSNAAGTSPFSTWLSQSAAGLRANAPIVQVGQTLTEPVGLPASGNGLIPDSVTGPPAIAGGPDTTTGSYMRDVLRALATIGSLTSGQANVTGFQDLVQDTRISLSGAISDMAQDAGALGNVTASLTTMQDTLAATETALTGQISSAEDVDMAETLSRLSLMQTQMQASYQLIATLNGLSLAKFLTAGA